MYAVLYCCYEHVSYNCTINIVKWMFYLQQNLRSIIIMWMI